MGYTVFKDENELQGHRGSKPPSRTIYSSSRVRRWFVLKTRKSNERTMLYAIGPSTKWPCLDREGIYWDFCCRCDVAIEVRPRVALSELRESLRHFQSDCLTSTLNRKRNTDGAQKDSLGKKSSGGRCRMTYVALSIRHGTTHMRKFGPVAWNRVRLCMFL